MGPKDPALSLKVGPKDPAQCLKAGHRDPFHQSLKVDPHKDISSLFYLFYSIRKTEKFFSNSLQATCSELIHYFLEKGFISESISHVVCLIRGSERFLSKVNKRGFQLKREVHATCLTSHLPDNSWN